MRVTDLQAIKSSNRRPVSRRTPSLWRTRTDTATMSPPTPVRRPAGDDDRRPRPRSGRGFGFGADWPAAAVPFELGGRPLIVLGSPGHHPAAITTYDTRTGFLLTGDTVLPGRLYAFEYPAFLATLDRLVAFTEEHAVTHVLGCHVEMRSRPGRDFPLGAAYQPGERAPQMTVEQLARVRDAAHTVAARRGVHRFDDFLIYNDPAART